MCNLTMFDITLAAAKKLPDKYVERARFIAENGTFRDFLDFCIAKKCFPEDRKEILLAFVLRYENLDAIYYEEDQRNLQRIYAAVGL